MKNDKRADGMKALYSQGLTLDEIGRRYGLSRQRIQQILKRVGVNRLSGGQLVKTIGARINKIEEKRKLAEKREVKALQIYGCCLDQVMALGPPSKRDTPAYIYLQSYENARRRGIPWEFTLQTWWEMWRTSGKWGQHHRGEFVVARYGDSGPYSPSNARVISWSQNSSEAREMDKILGRGVVLRMSHCKRGHELTSENRSQHGCRICANWRKRQARKTHAGSE